MPQFLGLGRLPNGQTVEPYPPNGGIGHADDLDPYLWGYVAVKVLYVKVVKLGGICPAPPSFNPAG